jgi:hypothetical protein
MARVDVTQQSIHGTWVDGYLPGLDKMKQLAQKYRHLDVDQRGLPLEYGFNQASEKWNQEDFFGSIGSALRTDFDYKNLSPDVRPAPCCMWLMKIDKQPSEEEFVPLYQEHKAEPRKKDYYHLVTIHDQCPVAESCFQQVIQKLHFEPKLDTAYADKERFIDAVHKCLSHYVDVVAAPWLEVERHLNTVSSYVTSVGP